MEAWIWAPMAPSGHRAMSCPRSTRSPTATTGWEGAPMCIFTGIYTRFGVYSTASPGSQS